MSKKLVERLHVEAKVPATTANVGSGFDCLGFAVDLWDKVDVYATLSNDEFNGDAFPEPIFQIYGQNAPDDGTNLVYKIMMQELGNLARDNSSVAEILPKLTINTFICDNNIPHARGLGSSSAAIVAGITLAHKLVLEALTRTGANTGGKSGGKTGDKSGANTGANTGALNFTVDINTIAANATRIEGHPDNVEPCVYGGAVFSPSFAKWFSDPTKRDMHFSVREDIATAFLVPAKKLSTSEARTVIPNLIPSEEAYHNTENVIKLVELLEKSHKELTRVALLEATVDYIHQPRREHLYPESYALMTKLRERSLPAVISGAGPTVMVLWPIGDTPEIKQLLTEANISDEWTLEFYEPINEGVQ